MDQMTLFEQNQPLTMSSREIAEVVRSRHDNVKVTIERLVDKGVIIQPAMQDEPGSDSIGRQRPISVYRLDKRSSLIVVAQLCPEFTAKIVDRWQELEASAQPDALSLPGTYLDALKALVSSVEAQQRAEYQAAELATENAKLLPKARVADTIAGADGLHSIAAAAKILGTGQRKLFSNLRDAKILNGHNVPFQQYIERGYFVSKESTYRAGDVDHLYPQTFVTGKGMCWLAKRENS